MRDKKQRRKISAGRSDSDFWLFFLSSCESIGLFLSSLMPAFEIFFLPLFPVIGAGSFFLLWRISSWVSWMKAAECWVRWRGERNTEGERDCISRHACVGSSHSPSTLGCHHSAQQSPAHNIQAVSRETRTRHILMCGINCTPVIGLLVPQQDSVCRNYSITTRLWWLACFA